MKTRKGSLNHKNDEKEKKIKVELKTQKGRLDCKREVIELKTRKIEQRMKVFYTKLRQLVGK